jgi:C4-dicarboxylate-specific signal transduction histidine kinase
MARLLVTVGRMHSRGLQARTKRVRVARDLLQVEVNQRAAVQADLERTRSELVDAARFAGRAEVATGALHNIGNALNSVTVATARASTLLASQRFHRMEDLARLLEKHDDPRLATYATELAKHYRQTHSAVQEEMAAALAGVEHVASIVAVQQEHARHGGLAEQVQLEDQVHKALVLVGLAGQNFVTVEGSGEASVDRQRLLQILGNLLTNARDAVSAQPEDGRIKVGVVVDECVNITVSDNGVGIAVDHVGQVFAHGFTTKSHGSGFGLHASAVAAQEMRGNLRVHSDGPGPGATFELTLPLAPPSRSQGRNTHMRMQRAGSGGHHIDEV